MFMLSRQVNKTVEMMLCLLLKVYVR